MINFSFLLKNILQILIVLIHYPKNRLSLCRLSSYGLVVMIFEGLEEKGDTIK